MQYQNNELTKFYIESVELTKMCAFVGLEFFLLLGEGMFCITMRPATPLLI